MKNVLRYVFIVFSTLNLLNSCVDREVEPILILATDAGFGTYTGEILMAEGFNAFRIEPAPDQKVSLKYLQRFDIIILADSIKPAIGQKLTKYVKNGGNLIAFRPNQGLDNLFGINKRADGSLRDGYIGIDTTSAQGKGLSGITMQFHGYADKYGSGSGQVIAKLYDGPDEETGYPAVMGNQYGKGQVIVFAYNLPESIVLTRQGDPMKAGMETDGIRGIRAMDMFTGNWINTSRNIINQADEQMRLLSHCIESMTNFSKPLPRFWYFPDKSKCLVTLTNDGEYRSETDFEIQFNDMDSMGAKMSLYVLESDKVSKDWVQKWTDRGFEISGHPDDTEEATDPRWENMYNKLLLKKDEIQLAYGLTMETVVNHWFVWCGKDQDGKPEFAAQAELGSLMGFEMDVNYAHYDNNSSHGHFLGPAGLNQGNYTGSGLILKFASSKGNILNIYQHLNNVYDQQYMENNDAKGFYECFKGLVDRSLNDEVYSYISIKAHNDEYFFSRDPLIKMLDYANQHDIPVWTVSELTDFIKMKDEARFSDLRWSGNVLNFRLDSDLTVDNGLTFLLPALYNDLEIKNVKIDGNGSRFITRKIKGHEYALITVEPGKSYDISAAYTRQ